ncbi:hypothetical protein GCM10025331_60610 [Actinoplanes utahensis]|nr:hypothetical protein Aut01nite_76290 [Actinoplanes utahensis]
MNRLSRARAALVGVIVVLVAQIVTVTAARAAVSGDLTTSAGSVATGPATSLAMAARGMTLVDSDLYVADYLANAIRKIDLITGMSSVYAGMGAANNLGDTGLATVAGINQPIDVAADAAGNIYIAAQSNQRIRRVDLGTAKIFTAYGDGTTAMLSNPQGVSVDPSGNIFFTEHPTAPNTGVARIFKMTGATVTTFATISTGRLSDIAFDSAGNVYVGDCQNHVILRFDAAGGAMTAVAGTGTGLSGLAAEGAPAAGGGIFCPRGLVVDPSDVIYFADSGNDRVRRFTVGGTISTVAGTGTAGISGDGGAAAAATLDQPYGLVRDDDGTFYVSQGDDMALTNAYWGIRKFTVGGTISTVAGNTWPTYAGDGGPAANAQLYRPGGVAFDGSGAMYIADSGNNRIRKVTGGIVSTVAGTGLTANSGINDGGPATGANLSNPQDVFAGSDGTLYISDTWHHRIRKVTPGGVISTIAGTGAAGVLDTGTATTTRISYPYGITVANGKIYFADHGNNAVRMISGTTITTIAGTVDPLTATFSGDGGPATSARLNGPRDVVVDASGDIYIADSGNRRVRKIHNGIITTVAGTGAAWTVSTDGGLATASDMDNPLGLEIDDSGNLYIADGSHVVRRVDKHGAISTVAGRQGSPSYAGDGLAGTDSASRLYTPARMAFDSSGWLHIAASGELRVRTLIIENTAAFFWISDATINRTGVVYGWEFVSRTATAVKSITFTAPSAIAGTTGLYTVSAVNLPATGTLSFNPTGRVVTYTLGTAVTIPAGRHLYLSVGGFTNGGTTGLYPSTVTTLTAGGATIDESRAGPIYLGNTAPVFVQPEPSARITAPASMILHVDPSAAAGNTVTSTVTVQTNAAHGYSVTVAGTAVTGTSGTLTQASSTGLTGAVASPAANRFGYTVTVGGAGQFTGTSGSYAGYLPAGEAMVTASRPTSVNGDVVQVISRMKADYLQPPGVYTGTVTYGVTGAY